MLLAYAKAGDLWVGLILLMIVMGMFLYGALRKEN